MGRLYTVALTILVAIIIICAGSLALMAFPFATGGFKVFKPSASQVKISTSGSNFTVRSPLRIIDNGPFPIGNLSLFYLVHNSTSLIANGNQYLGEVSGNYSGSVVFKIDFSNFFMENRKGAVYHLFHYDVFTINAYFTGDYGMNLISFNLSTHFNVPWIPPIEQFNVSKNVKIVKTNSSFGLEVPFTIGTAFYLNGQTNVTSELFYNQTPIGSSNFTIPLGAVKNSSILFEIPAGDQYMISNKQYFHIVLAFDMFSFPVVIEGGI